MPLDSSIVLLPPNRVWRTYQGGRTLDQLAGNEHPTDTHFPEDWVASTTKAANPGREAILEGISQVSVEGHAYDWAELLARQPDHFLGVAHVARFGAQPQLLVKLLDPAIRLHFQVHPTSAFARKFLHAPSGKTEAYHILSVRDEVTDPAIYLGFHTPPSRADLRKWIETQDIAAIAAAMNRVPVKPGDTLLVPGGVPHAVGEGILLVEIQEPSDLVVRFEFERGGYLLPEASRFMQRGLEFCLDVFDSSPWTAERIATESMRPPIRRRSLGPDSVQDDLITALHTPCFTVRRSLINAPVRKSADSFYIVIVTAGSCEITVGGETHTLQRYDKFFVPAGLPILEIVPDPTCTLLECYPPVA